MYVFLTINKKDKYLNPGVVGIKCALELDTQFSIAGTLCTNVHKSFHCPEHQLRLLLELTKSVSKINVKIIANDVYKVFGT